MHASVRESRELVAWGQIDVARLISHRLRLERIDETFRIARGREQGVVKAVVTFD